MVAIVAGRPRPGRAQRSPTSTAQRWLALSSWLDSGAWTEAAYFALPDTNHRLELSDGRLLVLPMPTSAHQQAVLSIAAQLRSWNLANPSGRVMIAPYPIRLWEEKIREPDVMFFLAEHRDRIGHQHGGPPDLAVEVLSPGTRRADLRAKLGEYAAAGITEYWLVDAEALWIDVFVLDGGVYRRVGRYHSADVAPSRLLPGFTIAVASLAGD